ncbi:glutamyl-tRNA(Gln) amidotransferase subunit PET112 KNAG_0B02290 [Huiozyma naganishii CBS 8797]|uniref:Glutamyl-tRNA(Gln) amidotransferase subunit B, mitochondrial n=1 Tax=Huiozyma naganishii (strain ATCC MYA-139 / BCRC 22969 / CBS 8797 / KCTC 17520 / NBRC 10181 / NCYC 3082 / Yp74L-3) TaxID=1071383 RepID=J7S4M6_HUIN7|nr:hypothetical protein KNAG_0B02290 [Kazachstania naganishii CBS 8797]CCK68671.1 hypothetical protein KNAG_0B02290 [Kazachstania naganishii CBS 8797]
MASIRYRLLRNTISKRRFTTDPNFKLICGLEVHTQLCTRNKLFSLSTNDPFASISKPNFHTSYFDIAVPGTKPKLNYECVLYALKLASALNSDINLNSQFDRKHYFYGDQPQGYQITQHYSPIAKGGYLEMFGDIDRIKDEKKRINITQLQLEQDTGMSHYITGDNGAQSMIDLNRSNVPLIELVTEPDFSHVDQVRAFIKKYQDLVRQLKISTGDLETGSMRVDVNVSINDYPRIELKNLPNTSSIVNAIKFEYQRQLKIIKSGQADQFLKHQETRGWDGAKTVKLRSKETTIDYRYMPDPELRLITLDADVIENVRKILPESSDVKIRSFLAEPFNLTVKDAKMLSISSQLSKLYNNEEVKQFFIETFHEYQKNAPNEVRSKLVVSWVLHELLGNLNKLNIPLKEFLQILPPTKYSELIVLVDNGDITSSSGKLLLFHVLKEFKDSNYIKKTEDVDFQGLIRQFDIGALSDMDKSKLEKECKTIIAEVDNPKLIESIKAGKTKAVKYLVGQGMRKFQGRVKAQELQRVFQDILNINDK